MLLWSDASLRGVWESEVDEDCLEAEKGEGRVDDGGDRMSLAF